MNLDIRLPIGAMFSLIGALLAISGMLTNSDTEMYRPSLGINVNLWWGLVLFLFGSVMLTFALIARKAAADLDKPQKPAETNVH
ncbi:MAG: hypothetical protein NTZ46_05440 [Verrucomicrobia bacterium]|nr:hypothetical protein [Verrucomicrobiota bacterium]